jgi:hypothetical protein
MYPNAFRLFLRSLISNDLLIDNVIDGLAHKENKVNKQESNER